MQDYEIANYVLETIEEKIKGRVPAQADNGRERSVKLRLVDKLLLERLKVHAESVIARELERIGYEDES